MNRIVLTLLAFCINITCAFAWGQLGHRVTGEIAWNHLTPKAQKKINALLLTESLAMSSTWMDFIKSDPGHAHMDVWHYCTVCDTCTYTDALCPSGGDVVQTIERLIKELKNKKFTDGDERQALRMLVHLIGDVHQPLHVGKPGDRGGNDVKIKWFGENTNLHAIWDTHMIEDQGLSYTELTKHLDKVGADTVLLWQKSHVRDWVGESQQVRMGIYPSEGTTTLSYRYSYDHLATAQRRLLQAGIRLAGVLNSIYE